MNLKKSILAKAGRFILIIGALKLIACGAESENDPVSRRGPSPISNITADTGKLSTDSSTTETNGNESKAADTSCQRDIYVGYDFNGGTKECYVTKSWEMDGRSCLAAGGTYLFTSEDKSLFKIDRSSENRPNLFPCLVKLAGHFKEFDDCATEAGKIFQVSIDVKTAKGPTATGAYDVKDNYFENVCSGDNGPYDCDKGLYGFSHQFESCPKYYVR